MISHPTFFPALDYHRCCSLFLLFGSQIEQERERDREREKPEFYYPELFSNFYPTQQLQHTNFALFYDNLLMMMLLLLILFLLFFFLLLFK